MAQTARITNKPARRFRPKPGRVYRTADLAKWTANPTRLAKQLVAQGLLKPLATGLYAAPKHTKFGDAPPKPEAIMDAFLGGDPYIFTGPEYWNALQLGATALYPVHIVYNKKRTGEFQFGGHRFVLRRCNFPKRPIPEWYVIDLIKHRDDVGLDKDTIVYKLQNALTRGTLQAHTLNNVAHEFGTKEVQALIRQAIEANA